MNFEYEMLDYMRDTVQGMVVAKGINFDDAVFYVLATMNDFEVNTLREEADHHARMLAANNVLATVVPQIEEWEQVVMACKRTLNARHGAKVREDYDRMLDEGQHMKGIQL
jgi:hypothetical protein